MKILFGFTKTTAKLENHHQTKIDGYAEYIPGSEHDYTAASKKNDQLPLIETVREMDP